MSKMQIVALKPGTREWIRINGEALECKDLKVKEEMLRQCPNLTKHFSKADDEHFALFEITYKKAELNTDAGKEEIH